MKTLLITTAVFMLLSCNNHHAAEEQVIQPVLLSHTNNKASCVYLTNDQNNDPVISWCEQDANGKKLFFMSVLDEKKGAFNNAINIPIEQNAVFMEEGMPKVAVRSDGTVIAVYETSAPTKQNGFAGFVYYIQSSDKGKTWTLPLCVHQDTASGKTHSFASLTRLSDGDIGACWLDVPLGGKNEGRSVRFAKTNGKYGFQHEQLLDSFACQCCRTAISSDDKGKVSVLFRDLLPGSIRDIAVSTSTDNGNTFSKSVAFSNNNWKIDGCPENGPSVADKNNITYAAWFSGGENKGVYYAELNAKRVVIRKKQISNNSRFIQ